MLTNDEKKMRIQLFETDYGHEYGWFVERNGERIATLSHPRYFDMFWRLFTVEPIIQDTEKKRLLSTDEFWGDRFLLYRNCNLNIVTRNFIVRWNSDLPEGTVILRGYPIDDPEPTLREKLLLFFRRFHSKQ